MERIDGKQKTVALKYGYYVEGMACRIVLCQKHSDSNSVFCQKHSDCRIVDGIATAACQSLSTTRSPAGCQDSFEGFQDKIEARSL